VLLPVEAELQAAVEATMAASVIPVIKNLNFLLISFAFISLPFCFTDQSLYDLHTLQQSGNLLFLHCCSSVHEDILTEQPYLKLKSQIFLI
jgi:hypothetical protein